MVRRNGHTRFLKLEMSVILTQTDTTVGFLSQNSKELFEVKSRDDAKPFLKVYSNFKNFLNNSNRVPSSKKKLIRRAKKTTFIVKNQAFRVSGWKLYPVLPLAQHHLLDAPTGYQA